jgi:hypothetical protein
MRLAVRSLAMAKPLNHTKVSLENRRRKQSSEASMSKENGANKTKRRSGTAMLSPPKVTKVSP